MHEWHWLGLSGTKYADKVEKAVSKRFPSMGAESWASRNYASIGRRPDAPFSHLS